MKVLGRTLNTTVISRNDRTVKEMMVHFYHCMLWLPFVLLPLTFVCQTFAFYVERSSYHVLTRIKTIATTNTRSTRISTPTALNVRERDVVVVGGGIGGLAVASRIASSSKDCKVTILEKNAFMGGRCGSFERHVPGVGTFRHERGPSLLLLPDVYRDLFQDCSKQEADAFGLTMAQCVPAYQVVFEDGDSIQVGFPRQSKETMGEEELDSRKKMNIYEPNGAQKWDEYMMATSAFLDAGLSNFIEERLDLASLPNFLREALRDFAKAWPLKPHSDVLDAIFESDKLKALASFQDLYVGLEPYRNDALVGGGVLKSTAPAVFGLLAAIELHPSNPKSGVFAPMGGFQKVTDATQRLAESLGVKIECNRMVTSISVDGVLTIHTSDPTSVPTLYPADLIVVNADLPYATKSILSARDQDSSKPIYDWDDRFSYSSGVIAFHWSLSKTCDDLNTHNVFLVAGSRSQAELSWETLRNNPKQENTNDDSDLAPPPFNFYVHRASQTDSSAAPIGCDSIMVLVPCQTLLRDKDCAKLSRDEALKKYQQQFPESMIAQVREAVLTRLAAMESLGDLRQWILDEVVDTPATWAEQYHLAAGTPFALSHGFAQLSVTRPSHYCRDNGNVLFCGASTRPGNGVPLVLIGAKQVSEKALRILKDKSSLS